MYFSHSCGIDLRNGKYVVTGGHGFEGQTTQYTEAGYDSTLPDLIHKRSQHACAMFRNGKGQIVREILPLVEFSTLIGPIRLCSDWLDLDPGNMVVLGQLSLVFVMK